MNKTIDIPGWYWLKNSEKKIAIRVNEKIQVGNHKSYKADFYKVSKKEIGTLILEEGKLGVNILGIGNKISAKELGDYNITSIEALDYGWGRGERAKGLEKAPL